MTTAEVQTTEETAKGIIDGMFSFIDTEVVPLEEQYRDILSSEAGALGNRRSLPFGLSVVAHAVK